MQKLSAYSKIKQKKKDANDAKLAENWEQEEESKGSARRYICALMGFSREGRGP